MTDPQPLVAIVGTVGVPARYGGFETLAEQLARNIDPAQALLLLYGQKSAYAVTERAGDFAGHRRHFMPLSANGVQSMVHDALTMAHAALVARADIMLVLGTSGAWMLPLVRLLRPSLLVVTNIDGLEWRRDKFGPLTKRLLKTLEWFAVKSSHAIIADNAALVPIVRDIHGIDPALIAYGGDHVQVTAAPGPAPQGHWLAIARVEPENNSAMILEGAAAAGVALVFVGNWDTNAYGRALKSQWGGVAGLTLHDPVYDQPTLARLRAGAAGYIHGHSVGGTNPSLVEALFETDRVLAYDCAFNRATLDDQGDYFPSAAALAVALARPGSGAIAAGPLNMLRHRYRWRTIAADYLAILRGGGRSATAGETGPAPRVPRVGDATS
jgi:glycosyltransferase involved in cell wall biosynthesis